MPLKGYDKIKEEKIRKVLERAKNDGIWIRELARQAKIPYSTVHHYLNNSMKNDVVIENVKFGAICSEKFKLVKLKRFG
jgi:response regulator of citrate/malate metabolism